MEKVTACSPEDPVSVGADSTKDDDDTEDEVFVDVGRDHNLHSSRYERRSRVDPAFKIALYQELQRMKGNPFMARRRKARTKAWDALATKLKSVKEVTCKGSFGERTYDVRTPEKCDGNFCKRYFIRERSRRKNLEKEGLEGTGAGPRNAPGGDIFKAEDEEFKKALRMIEELKEFIKTSKKDVGKRYPQDADDSSSSHEEEDLPSEKKSRKGKRRHEDTAEELDSTTSDPPVEDVLVDDAPSHGALFSRTEDEDKLERLFDAVHGMSEKMRSGPGRSADGANISTQLSGFEDRVENHFCRISRDIRMIEDEMTRLRRTISSLHDEVLGLAQARASGPRRGFIP